MDRERDFLFRTICVDKYTTSDCRSSNRRRSRPTASVSKRCIFEYRMILFNKNNLLFSYFFRVLKFFRDLKFGYFRDLKFGYFRDLIS